VPVFHQSAKNVVEELTKIVIGCIGDDIKKVLSNSPIMFQLYCRQHGVPKEEVANEVYHILFGMLNEELVSRGIVQEPNLHVGEGRYLNLLSCSQDKYRNFNGRQPQTANTHIASGIS